MKLHVCNSRAMSVHWRRPKGRDRPNPGRVFSPTGGYNSTQHHTTWIPVCELRPAILIALVLFASPAAIAYEADQFTNRRQPVEDSTPILDAKVNDTIANIVSGWRGPRDDWKVVNGIYHEIGGMGLVDKLESWARKSSEVDRLPTERYRSIYRGHPFWATRVVAFFGIGPTIKVNGQLIGSDKLGHFLSQGRKFYRRYLKTRDEAQAAERSAYTERAIFGQVATGVYSNADLVANYEGYRFYRSLFEDGVVEGKPAILAWKDDGWVIQRPFTWADYVNAYWDEALNVNHFDRWLYPRMKERLLAFCPDYRANPQLYAVEDDQALSARYADLELRDSRDLRLDRLCSGDSGGRSDDVARPSR